MLRELRPGSDVGIGECFVSASRTSNVRRRLATGKRSGETERKIERRQAE